MLVIVTRSRLRVRARRVRASPSVRTNAAPTADYVFAGADIDATDTARSYFAPYRPSSPQIALFKDGKLVYMLERHQIEGKFAEQIAHDLTQAFDEHCAPVATK